MISVVVDTDRWIDSICESVADGFVWQEFEDDVWRCDDSLLVIDVSCMLYTMIALLLLCFCYVSISYE